LLFDAQKEEDKKFLEVWKTEGLFESEQVESKVDKEETQLEHYQKVMDGYYEAWRGNDESCRERHHRLTVTMKQEKDVYFFLVSTTGQKRHTMISDT